MSPLHDEDEEEEEADADGDAQSNSQTHHDQHTCNSDVSMRVLQHDVTVTHLRCCGTRHELSPQLQRLLKTAIDQGS